MVKFAELKDANSIVLDTGKTRIDLRKGHFKEVPDIDGHYFVAGDSTIQIPYLWKDRLVHYKSSDHWDYIYYGMVEPDTTLYVGRTRDGRP